MEILTYSPSVEAYVEVRTSPSTSDYWDLTNDITSCNVNRNQDGESTFSITLQNRDSKYDGVFTPMDRIVIYAVKEDRYPLLAGFITNCDCYRLYRGDFKMSGKCTIYKMVKLFWDPGLRSSWQLFSPQNSENKDWQGYARTIYDYVCTVGGWNPDNMAIGDVPQAVMDWARELYEARAADTGQIRSMVGEFYEILRTHGPKFSAASRSLSEDGSHLSGDQPISGEGGGAFLTGVDFNMSESEFVRHWGDRINNWYSWKWPGSPLEGHGETYARAAYKARFEPRFLPAVSGAEQSGGLVESGLNGNYYGWAVYDSGIGSLAYSANGIDSWIYYLLSDEAIFAGKPLYQQDWGTIAASWASSSAWADRVMGFMMEI